MGGREALGYGQSRVTDPWVEKLLVLRETLGGRLQLEPLKQMRKQGLGLH